MRLTFSQLKGALIVALLAVCSAVYAQDSSSVDLKALVKRADTNLSPLSFRSVILMENTKSNAPSTKNETLFWRKDKKMLAIIRTPQVQRGQALLRNNDDMWFFLPKSKKVTRIGAKEKSFGGEASNSDLLRLDLAEDYDQSLLGEDTIDGNLCWKLELKAVKRTVAYDKIIYWISKKSELPVKREFYSLSGEKLKTTLFTDVGTIGGRVLPRVTTIINELNPDYKTIMTLKEFKVDNSIPDSLFTTGWLESGGSLEQ